MNRINRSYAIIVSSSLLVLAACGGGSNTMDPEITSPPVVEPTDPAAVLSEAGSVTQYYGPSWGRVDRPL